MLPQHLADRGGANAKRLRDALPGPIQVAAEPEDVLVPRSLGAVLYLEFLRLLLPHVRPLEVCRKPKRGRASGSTKHAAGSGIPGRTLTLQTLYAYWRMTQAVRKGWGSAVSRLTERAAVSRVTIIGDILFPIGMKDMFWDACGARNASNPFRRNALPTRDGLRRYFQRRA